jgi:hypothetical protein
VPARRLVREASLEPASIERSRVSIPAGGTVADGASVAAKWKNLETAAGLRRPFRLSTIR